jgi:large subunit ribosomal protein L31
LSWGRHLEDHVPHNASAKGHHPLGPPGRNFGARGIVSSNCCVVEPLRASFATCKASHAQGLLKGEGHMQGQHPELTLATVRCSTCGNVFTTRSTRSEVVVDVCSSCHPAYTGVERAVARSSRIERFERRRQNSRNLTSTR